MARKGKIHKGDRDKRIEHLRAVIPNIVNPPHKMSREELQRKLNQRRQSGIKGKTARQSRERQDKRLRRKGQW